MEDEDKNKRNDKLMLYGMCILGALGCFALGHPVPACWLIAVVVLCNL